MSAQLFDDFERADASPRRHEEADFAFLNRVDQPFWQRIRVELDRWYAEYPDAEHGFGLRERFRKPDPAQHFGAWWELYLHRVLRRLGFEVEVEPSVSGGKPDFRLVRGSESFLLEATTSFSGIVDERRHPDEAALLSAIDQAENPNFSVGVDIQAVGTERPKVREIVGPLERWLEGLDPNDVLERGYFDAPVKVLDVRGWKVEFTAIALSPEARGRSDHRVWGMGPVTAGWVNDRDKLSAALVSKRRKYKPEEPFVIAVLMMSSGSMDREDIEATLLGPVVYPVDPEGSGLGQPFRQRKGFWIAGTEPRSTRVSAVLIGNNITPENAARTWPRLWPNPWAARPLTVDLPFPRGIANQQGGAAYEEVTDLPNSVLGLPRDWPGPGKPFTKAWSAG